eukprot:IDg19694t1
MLENTLGLHAVWGCNRFSISYCRLEPYRRSIVSGAKQTSRCSVLGLTDESVIYQHGRKPKHDGLRSRRCHVHGECCPLWLRSSLVRVASSRLSDAKMFLRPLRARYSTGSSLTYFPTFAARAH